MSSQRQVVEEILSKVTRSPNFPLTHRLCSVICNYQRGFSVFSLRPSQLDGEEAPRVSQRREVSLETVTARGQQVRLGFNWNYKSKQEIKNED